MTFTEAPAEAALCLPFTAVSTPVNGVDGSFYAMGNLLHVDIGGGRRA